MEAPGDGAHSLRARMQVQSPSSDSSTRPHRRWRSGCLTPAAREGLASSPPTPTPSWTRTLQFKAPSARLWWGSATCSQPGPCLCPGVPGGPPMALRGWPQGCWLYGRSASAVIAHPMTTGGNGSSPREDRGKAALQQSLSPQCLCVPGPSHLWAVTCEGPECTDDQPPRPPPSPAPPDFCGHLLTASLTQRLLPGGSLPCAGHTVSDPPGQSRRSSGTCFCVPGRGLRCRERVWRGGWKPELSAADVLGRWQDVTATPAYSLEVK